MNVNELRKELSHRLSLHINDGCGIEESWEKLTEVLSENVSETISFFNTECTDEEFFWLSEVFTDIAEKTQSKALIQAMRSRLARVTCESYDQNSFNDEHMRKWIDYSEYVRSVSSEINYADEVIEE